MSFNCSVVSSPEPSTIMWNIADTDRYTINNLDPVPNSDREVGGVVTTSVLTLERPEGSDSGLIQCRATHQSEILNTTVIQANATVTFFGEPAAW